MKLQFRISLVLFMMICSSVIAQRIDLTGGNIGITFTDIPQKALKDTSGFLGYHSLGIALKIPLWGNLDSIKSNISGTGRMNFFQSSLNTGFQTFNTDIGFIPDSRNFYYAFSGLGLTFNSGFNNIFMADAGIGFAGDQFVIQNGNLRYRLSGSFIAEHLKNRSFSYQYGLIFTYAYGRPLLLPVLGLRTKLSDSWSLSAILPAIVMVSDKINRNLGLNFQIRPSGNRFEIQNQNNFNTSSSVVYMQIRQFEAGARINYRISKQFSLYAEAGLLAGGRLRFTEMNSTNTLLYQTGIKDGTKFRISLRYHLSDNHLIRDDISNEL